MTSQPSTSASGRGCAICGASDTEKCHVRAKRSFNENEISQGADETRNILYLCRSHHRLMDEGWVAIAPSCDRVMYRDGTEKVEEDLQYTVNISKEYIHWRNQYSQFVRPFSQVQSRTEHSTVDENDESDEIRSKLYNRLYELDLEQFKHLCKIVIEKVENPQDIEVTPSEAPEEPHIRGQVGESLYIGEFGVHAFQMDGPVKQGVVGEIGNQLKNGGYRFGTLITLSSFNEKAISKSEQIDGVSLWLVDGDDLIDMMLNTPVGVVSTSDGFDFETTFWSKLDKFYSGDLISSTKVPQADSLELLVPTLQAIRMGHKKKSDIGEYLRESTGRSLSDRQGLYYATAAHLLGLLEIATQDSEDTSTRRWELSSEGREYLERANSSDYIDREYLEESLRDIEIIQEIEARFSSKENLNHADLMEVIREETEVTGSTVERRATCLGKWFGTIQGRIKRPNLNRRIYEYYPNGGIDSYY